ncbi:MAG: carbohydrate ABC transporter substrate-binding protein [Clostridiales bacterium]|nr:carbohydrate ABC transporter substrate-binding protein [Clostridiales bacterium]
MEKWKRIIAFALATVMLSTVCLTASSCKKKGAKKKTVLETDPFYTTKRLELDPKLSLDDFYSVTPVGPWMCHDKFAMIYSVENKPTEKNPYPEGWGYLMGIFDMEGNLLQMVDLENVLHSVPGTGAQALGLCEGEKGIRLYFENFASTRVVNPDTITPANTRGLDEIREFIYSCEFDSNTGEVIKEPHLLRTDPDGVYFFSLSFIEGYEVGSVQSYDEERNTTLMIVVSKDGEPLYHVELDKVFGPGVIRYVDSINGAGNGTAIINCMGNTPLVAKFDLKTGTMTKVPDAKPISDNQKISSTSEGKGYITKATGIYEYDPTGANEDCVLNFDHCDINRYESQTANVLSCDENKVILGCSPRMEGQFLLPDPVPVYILEKAEKNPNAGKTVLTVASLSDSVTYFEGEALRTFNEKNPDYHVQLVLYDQNAYQKSGELTDDIDASDRQMYSALSMVSGSLSMDIRSGNGPDVILGAASSIELLDSQYLTDLTPYLERQTYDASRYYSKIIDASKIDGKTFFIPTSFTIAGIVTDGSKMDDGQAGFTYDQYISYVEDQRNGNEPVTEFISRMHFLNLCFQRSYDQWVKDKKMNIEQEDFCEMAAFFKEKIPDGVSSAPKDQFDMRDLNLVEEEEKIFDVVFIENISGIGNLARYNYFGNSLRIFGLPSKNGTGPSANIASSFSITEGSEVKDGAYALLDILLSKDVQNNSMDAIPINREAASYRVEKQKENNRNGYSFMTSPMVLCDEASMRAQGLYSPDLKFADIFLETLENVDTVFLSDNSIMMIVDEELPAYLLGQKDLDSVIATINNRSQNVFNER